MKLKVLVENNTPQGLVIITGCSHAEICNIIEQAKNIFKEEKVIDVIGGFYLQDPSQKQLERTKSYFDKLKPKLLMHLTVLI